MRKLKTVDGRDVSNDEFRPIPSFPEYQINSHGDLIGRNGWLLTESYNKTSRSYYYALNRADGRTTSRSYRSLVDEAFPEIAVPKKPKRPKPKPKVEWRDIPGFPKHQISEEGIVRYKAGRHRVLPIMVNNEKKYRLINEWGLNTWTVDFLRDRAFPELKEVAA